MSKVLFTCALVVNLLIVSCATVPTTNPTPSINDGLRSVLEKILARRDKIVETIGMLAASSKELNTAIAKGRCGKSEQMLMAKLSNSLKNLLTLLTANEQEKYYIIPAPIVTTTPMTDTDSETEDK